MDILISDYSLFIIAISWLIFASISDLKKREVANWLSFSLIAVAIGIRAITSVITLDYSYFFNALFFTFIFFILANVFYYTKIFAGGDAKLLIALGALFATKPDFSYFYSPFNIPFPVIFLLNILVVASVYGIIYSIGLALRNHSAFINSFKKVYKKTRFMLILIIFIFMLAIPFFFIIRYYELLLFVALILIFPYVYLLVRAVEDSCMIKEVAASDLTEGDWIINSVKVRGRIINPSVDGLSKEDIALLRKNNKIVAVKYGIPFVPVFLITAVLSVFFGNLFYVIASFLFNLL